VRLVKDHDDFIGVQNYSRNIWLPDGTKAPNDPNLPQNQMHTEVYAPSLAGCVRWTYAQTNIPILITEHGVSTTDDSVRADLIPAALTDVAAAIADGVPVLGYCHWSLLDNFEWIFGYEPVFGLVHIDRANNLERTRKPSSFVYEKIARNNAI
jgi:beta-glucosidase